MEEKTYGQTIGSTSSSDEIVKDVTKVLKKVSVGALDSDDVTLPGIGEYSSNNIGGTNAGNISSTSGNSKFKVCNTTALAKPTIWTKIKNVLLTEIEVELTPYQQKVENEVNEFLHKEITWQNVKAFWTQEVKITL